MYIHIYILILYTYIYIHIYIHIYILIFADWVDVGVYVFCKVWILGYLWVIFAGLNSKKTRNFLNFKEYKSTQKKPIACKPLDPSPGSIRTTQCSGSKACPSRNHSGQEFRFLSAMNRQRMFQKYENCKTSKVLRIFRNCFHT